MDAKEKQRDPIRKVAAIALRRSGVNNRRLAAQLGISEQFMSDCFNRTDRSINSATLLRLMDGLGYEARLGVSEESDAIALIFVKKNTQ